MEPTDEITVGFVPVDRVVVAFDAYPDLVDRLVSDALRKGTGLH